MNAIKQAYVARNIQARRAFWLSMVYALLLLVYGLSLIPELVQTSNVRNVIANLMPWGIGILSLLGALLILNGRVKAGGQVVIITTLVGMISVPLVVEQYGPTAAMVAIVVSSVMASQTQTGRSTARMIVIGLAVGLTIIIIDLFWPFNRLPTDPRDFALARALALLLAVLYGGLILSQFNHMPITTKLVITSLVLTLVPMAVVAYASTTFSAQALQRSADLSLISSAAQVAARLDSFVLFNMNALRTEAQIGEFIEVLEMPAEERQGSEAMEDATNMLTSFKQRDPVFITSYAVLDINGITIADTQVREIGDSKLDRDYVREPLRTGLPYVSQVRVSPVTGDASIYFSAPVRSETGEIIGLLRVRYNAAVLQQIILGQHASTGQDSFAILISDENIVLANSGEPRQVNRSIVPLSNAKVIELQKKRVIAPKPTGALWVDLPGLAENITGDAVGVGFVGMFHENEHDLGEHSDQANSVRMSTRPWTVVVAQSQDLLLQPIAEQERGNMVVGMIAAVVSIVTAVFVSRFLAQPVVNLTEVAKQVAAGNLNARATVTTRDEIGTLGSAFNQMAGQLHSMVTGLEQRVADRTKALATSAEVSRRLSTILDQDVLVKEVVEQLQRAFNYYHVHIYLFDDAHTNLVLAGGSGEAGRQMLARAHKIASGRGLVGRAAETGVTVLVPDVSRAEGWLPNPLLPETRSEVAVPIIVGDQVLGVLDVQENRVEGLKQEDADLLQSIANQVAVGLQNARAYAETQRRANREATISAINQQIQRTTTPEEALKIAAREVGRLIGTETIVRLKLGGKHQSPGSDAENGQNNGRSN